MFTLRAENRNAGAQPKQLRRSGIIPGVLYGKDLAESLRIQISQREVVRFLQSHSTGSKAELMIDGKKFPALLREAVYKPATDDLQHLSFQMLVADEAVTSTAKIVLINREKVSGFINHANSELSYRALPSHMIEKVEIDLDGMKVGDSLRISDLDVANNPDIEILSPLDTMVLSISDAHKPIDAAETEDDDASGAASE